MPSAKAADLGGDCCADLEERVAELEATTARKGNRRVSLTVSGQVNTAVMFWDDGRSRDTFIVDNANSRSAFQFDGTAKINPNLTAGFQLVIGLAAGARSHTVSQLDDDGTADDGTLGVELANWFLRHDQLGELRVGRANTASAGTTTVDLGGAGVIANAQFGLWQRSFFLTEGDVQHTGTWSALTGGTPINVSGLSRGNAVSYTTPTLGGFSLQAAWGEDNQWDVAARYAGEFSGFRLAAAIAYGQNLAGADDPGPELAGTSPADIVKIQGSASVLHVASGLFLTGAYITQSFNGATDGELVLGDDGVTFTDINRPDIRAWYLQGGVSKNWTGMGNTVLYGEYGEVKNGATGTSGSGFGFGDAAGPLLSSSANFWGLGVVQHVDAAAMELFLAYRQYSGRARGQACDTIVVVDDVDTCTALDDPESARFNDFSVVMGGARIKF
jgi:hypothetical protein